MEKHPISELFEYTQATKLPQPREILLREYGPAHSKKFFIQFDIGGVRYKAAEGRNKDEARKLAALHALDQLRSKAQKRKFCGSTNFLCSFYSYLVM